MAKKIGGVSLLGLVAFGLTIAASLVRDRESKSEMKEAVDEAVDRKLKALSNGK